MNSAHLIKLYTVYFLLTSAALVAASLALQAFLGAEIGGSLGVVTIILPAMLVGQRYAKRWQARPPNGYAWRLTGVFTAISYVLGCVAAVAVLVLGAEWSQVGALFVGPNGSFVLGVFVALFFLFWLLARFFFGFGAKTQLRSMAEQAARAREDANQP